MDRQRKEKQIHRQYGAIQPTVCANEWLNTEMRHTVKLSSCTFISSGAKPHVLLVPFSLERNNSQAFSCFQILIAWLTVGAPQAKCRRMCTTYNGKVHYFSTGTELTVFRIESLTQFGWRRWELSWNSSLFEITRVIHEWFHVKSLTFRSGVPMSGK